MNRLLVAELLMKSWSIKTSSKWTNDNPARGQCGVTALIIQDKFGGEIAKTIINGQSHFYNIINGQRFDFTESQFNTPPEYLDLKSSREEAFADTNAEQYIYLSTRFQKLTEELK